MLDFTLVEDTYIPEQDKRWVLVAPPGNAGTMLLLGRPSTLEQHAFIGNQTGGRVTFFLCTDDFWRDYETMVERGVEFVRAPQVASYGTVAVFKDLYGNLWDLVERKTKHATPESAGRPESVDYSPWQTAPRGRSPPDTTTPGCKRIHGVIPTSHTQSRRERRELTAMDLLCVSA